MAGDLAMKIERKNGKVSIVWMDAMNNHHNAHIIQQVALVVWFFIFLFLMFDGLQNHTFGGMGIGFVLLMIVFFIPAFLPKFFYESRYIVITNKMVKTKFGTVPLGNVSRVEYNSRSAWDNSKKHHSGNTQVRIWADDRDSIIAAQNDWTTEVNHKIHRAIQDEIRAMQKSLLVGETPVDTTEPPKKPPSGNFGMPDY